MMRQFSKRIILAALAGSIFAPAAGAMESPEKPAAKADVGSTVATKIPNGYSLIWSDEFSKPGLPDATKWKYDAHRNKKGWYNNEKQYYAAARLKNSRIENGKLILEAHQEGVKDKGFADWGKQKYTSARLLTQGVGDWTYGFYEVRAKLPCGVGTWPAIWMLPSDPNVKWPNGGEIDIMEHVGYEPGIIHHSVHTKAFNFGRGTQKTTKHEVADACKVFHKYQLLWTSKFLLFGLDDKPKFIFKKQQKGNARWPFDKPQHLLLNIAVGGSWGGQKGIEKSAFPARMEVDYVRIYQPKPIVSNEVKSGSK